MWKLLLTPIVLRVALSARSPAAAARNLRLRDGPRRAESPPPTPAPTHATTATNIDPLLELPFLTNDAEYGLTTEQKLVLLEHQRVYGICHPKPIARLEPWGHAFTTKPPVFSLRTPEDRTNDLILHTIDIFQIHIG